MLTAIFKVILTLSVSGSIVALAILIIRALFWRRMPARLQYAVWGLLLIRLALPVLPASPFSMFNIQLPAPPAAQQAATANSGSGAAVNVKRGQAPQTIIVQNNSASDYTAYTAPNTANAAPAKKQAAAFVPGFNYETASLIWLLGAGFALLYFLAVNIAVRIGLSRQQTCREPAVIRILENCQTCLGLHMRVKIICDNREKSPAVFGVIHPRIIISKKICEQPDPETLKYILMHELTHAKRHDNALCLAVMFFEALNWFNPVLWYAFNKMKEDCEISCDASVLAALGDSERRAYGYAIINILQAMPSRFVPGTAHFAGSFTKRRIVMIAKGKKASIAFTSVALAAVMLAGCASLPAKNQTAPAVSSSNTASSEKASSLSSSSSSSALAGNKNTAGSPAADWIYYVDSSKIDKQKGTICRLFRSHADGSDKAQVSDVETSAFVVSDDWIYYSEFNRKGIYKIHGDGTGKTKLNSCTGGPSAFYNGYLYLCYVSKSDPEVTDAEGFIYRMKSDGTNLQKICTDKVTLDFQLSNGYIFYPNDIDNSTLYRICPDGTGKKKLTGDTTGVTFSIFDNTVYYIRHDKDNCESPGSIYKMSLDGTDKTALGIKDAIRIKVSDSMLYYENEPGKFFKAKLDGTGITGISKDQWETTERFGNSSNSEFTVGRTY